MFKKKSLLTLVSETIIKDSSDAFVYKAVLENNISVVMNFKESFFKCVTADKYKRCILIVIEKDESIEFSRKSILDIVSRKLNIRDHSLNLEFNKKNYIFSDGQLLEFSENEYLFTQFGYFTS